MNDEQVREPFIVHRSSFIVSFALLFAACARRPAHPNVLLITLDTFRADRIGAATPHLRALAQSGVDFRQADSAVPLTLPSHTTILSGLLPLHHGLRNNGTGAMSRPTLATAFSSAGYRTGAFVSAFVLDHRFGLARGFDVYDDEVPRETGAARLEAERRGEQTVDRARAWLTKGDHRPFFAWVHLYDAHAPYAPPPPLPQTYDGEIAYVDAQVGRLLSAVDQRSTVIVVAGDHGEGLGEHGELTHGLFVYESTLHVPLIIAGAGIKPRAIDQAVSLADLAPTIAELAGVAIPAADGRSLRAAILSNRSLGEVPIYSETQYPRTFGWTDFAALRVGDHKATTARELFDLRRDPGERTNVMSIDRRTYGGLTSQLATLRQTATPGSATVVDDETRRKLASLGYVAPQVSQTVASHDASQIAELFRRFEEANWTLAAGHTKDAVAPLEDLVRRDPGNPTFRSTLARALRETGEPERALGLYRQAVALAPNDADAWYNLAAALQESGDPREGAAALERAAQLDPARPEMHDLRGVELAQSGDLDGALREFRSALAVDPRDARALNNIGNVLRVNRRNDEAESAYRQAIAIAPQYTDPLNGLGALLAQNGRVDEAIQYFDAALKIAPDYYEAQLNRGIAFSLAGKQQEARAEWRRLLQRLPPGRPYDSQRRVAQVLLSQSAR